MNTTAKLTHKMQEAVDVLLDNNSSALVKWRGGFWTYEGCPALPRKDGFWSATWDRDMPAWQTSRATVAPMIARGILAATNHTYGSVSRAALSASWRRS